MDFLIADIQEKEVAEPMVPSFPQLKSTATGFPEHKKRSRVSAFKQKRQASKPEEHKPKVTTTASTAPLSASSHDAQHSAPSTENFKASEQQSIDRENNDKLSSMSPQEIEAARQELFNGLDPSVLEMLLKRANLDEAANASALDHPDATPTLNPPEIRIEDTSAAPSSSTLDHKTAVDSTGSRSSKHVRFASVVDEEEEDAKTVSETNIPPPPQASSGDSDNSTPKPSPAEHPTTTTPNADTPSPPKPHWPHPPQPEDIDPHDPDFLQKLHSRYFPSLPADPSKLAWMAPVPTPNSPADQDSPYHPSQTSLPVSALRFDFRGTLLPPRVSRAVPMTKGLHHHGEAPEAAGYTVRELGRLCRSAVPGQRCVAYQTLGRVLYRLGRGQFGGAGPDDHMARGLWAEVEECAVLRSLYEEAGTEEGSGHRSARIFAIEAIWLFEKGGWKERLQKGR
ncbi:hypothetical protein GGR54DRAFT_628813 [Hypoxylon sp. NC1633]|nr:hypothetical protein GGR54DRAFT_628813 [Hypoxylon sp. NC1633]